MDQKAKHFAEELNKSLDDIGVPREIRERSSIVSKMFHIPKQTAWSLLEGHTFPDQDLLRQIATELEIDVNTFLS